MNKSSKQRMAVAMAMAMVMVAGLAFAHGENGRRGEGKRWECANGQSQGSKDCWGKQLSEADREKLQDAREAFFEETKDLRQDMRQKRLEMRAEMAKKSPDSDKLFALQKEVSELHGQFAEKKLAHRLEMREQFPDLPHAGFGGKRGFGRKGGGYGGCARDRQ